MTGPCLTKAGVWQGAMCLDLRPMGVGDRRGGGGHGVALCGGDCRKRRITHHVQVGGALPEVGAQVELFRPWRDGDVSGFGAQEALDDRVHAYLPELSRLMSESGASRRAVLGICLWAPGLGAWNLIGAAAEFGWTTVLRLSKPRRTRSWPLCPGPFRYLNDMATPLRCRQARCIRQPERWLWFRGSVQAAPLTGCSFTLRPSGPWWRTGRRPSRICWKRGRQAGGPTGGIGQ